MRDVTYELPEYLRGFKGFLRWLAFRVTFYTGLIISIANAALFLFSPGLFNDGTFEKTFANMAIMLAVIFTLGGISVGLYYLAHRMQKWWPNV
jgi:hypothetical protein